MIFKIKIFTKKIIGVNFIILYKTKNENSQTNNKYLISTWKKKYLLKKFQNIKNHVIWWACKNNLNNNNLIIQNNNEIVLIKKLTCILFFLYFFYMQNNYNLLSIKNFNTDTFLSKILQSSCL